MRALTTNRRRHTAGSPPMPVIAHRRRILFYINSLARGGAETQLMQVARLASAAGHAVAVVTLTSENDFRRQRELDGPQVMHLGLTGLWSLPRVLWRAAAFARRWRADVTIGFLYQATMLMRAVNLLVPPERSIASIRNERLENPWRSRSYFRTSFLDDVIVVNSETARRRLVEAGTAPVATSAVIYNGIDVDHFSWAVTAKRARVRQELGLTDEDYLFLGVGRLTPQKRWDLLVDAVAGYAGPAPLACVIAGEGPLRASLEERIAHRGVSEQMSLLGLRHDVDALMAAADALILCSSYEGTPNVVLEAQAAGLPVIATDVGACAELLDGTNGVLIEPGQAEALATAMAKVAARGPVAARAFVDGLLDETDMLRRLRSRFSWDRVGREWLTIINDDADSPGRATVTTSLEREAHALLSPPRRVRGYVGAVAIVLFGVVAGAAVGLAYSTQQPKLFASEALVRVFNPYRANGALFGQVDQLAVVTQEWHYATSAKTTDTAKSSVSAHGLTIDHVDWQALPSEDALSVRCYARRAAAAAQCADIYSATYVAFRRETAPASVTAQNEALSRTIAGVKAQIARLANRIASVKGVTPIAIARAQSYIAQSTALYQQLNALTASLNQGKQQEATLAANYEVIATATTARKPAIPATKRNVAAGGGAGLLLGLLVAAAFQGARAPRRLM